LIARVREDRVVRHWLVDGMNVIGSRPDGWWRDRRGAMKRLIAELAAFADRENQVTVVLDSAPFEVDPGDVAVVFAPGGPNAADDEIVRRVRAAPDASSFTVVTSDKGLIDEIDEIDEIEGAEVVSAGAFREMLDERH
jgi:predicted RNA-binding protein with PIN domain